MSFVRILFFILIITGKLQAQTVCTTPGQTPATAFPVCASSTFIQTTVPLCGGTPMPFTGCGNDGLTDINPFWYKFTCYQSGTLGFLITPNNLSSDYDWELYDITGRQPGEVFTNGSLVVSNNWSGETGLTGASSGGSQTFVCGGSGKPLFSKMPDLIAGHDYLLLVSHFTPTQSGYKLDFSGGTANITDTTIPRLKTVEAICSGDKIRVKTNRPVKCSSIAANGSDFFVMPSGVSIVSAKGIGCANGFDSDSMELVLASPLPPGNYTMHVKKGSDGNTFLNNCDLPMPETETMAFTILPRAPTPMDSLIKPACAPNQLKLIFKKALNCASIAADGSDFIVSGNYPVRVISAQGACGTNGTSKEITVLLSAPMFNQGAFNLILKKGADGNTLIDECGEETPAGSSLPFFLKDTVSAAFTYNISYGCTKDTVAYFHSGNNGVNSWQWSLDEKQESIQQNPVGIYAVFNEKKVTLAVSNGFCSDTSNQTILLDNYLEADFSVFEDNCPSEAIPFSDSSKGKIVSYAWNFGDGGTSDSANPHHVYAPPLRETSYIVSLTVNDSFGCRRTAQKKITIYSSCYLAVPNAFTPNADGKNDFFHPLNAIKAENVEFLIFNRWGNLVHKTANWKQGWNGMMNGKQQPTGTYVWLLRYTDRDTKKKIEQKGMVTLIR